MYPKKIYRGFSISKLEIHELIKAWVAISIAFSIVLSGGLIIDKIIPTLLISALTVGIGFLLHELGHKIVAQRYGCFAEFRSFNSMLWLMIIMSFFGLVFAAPGAVFIEGPVGVKRNGKISAAGPIVNIFLALIFLFISLFFTPIGFFSQIVSYGLRINSWLALFNMIPIWQLDGKKILAWNKLVYGIMVGIAFILTFGAGYLMK